MKLLERYALETGLKVGTQHLYESFYPLEVARYITFQTGSGMAAKNYPYYGEVIALLRDYLARENIAIVQLGGKDDVPLGGAIHMQGKTSLHESNYLLRRSLLHIGNDSWMAHRAGALRVPLVVLYGSTRSSNHGPYDYDPAITALIESHRFGRNPTFSTAENPATIAVIPPEQIASAALNLLSAPAQINRRSIYIGPQYHEAGFEIIPNMVPNPQLGLGVPAIRMDLADNEDAENWLVQNLNYRKCVVITDREINLNIFAQFRPNIVGVRVYIDKVSAQWIKTLRHLGVPTQFYCRERDPVKVAAMRLDLFDACFFSIWEDPTLDTLREGARVYLDEKELDMESILPKLHFKSNHFVLSKGSIHLSVAHWRTGRTIDSVAQNVGEVINTAEFWATQREHYYFETT